MEGSPKPVGYLTWPRYFVLIVIDILAAYQVVLLAIDVFFMHTKVKLSFANVQLFMSLLASVLSGHIFMSSVNKVEHMRSACETNAKVTRKNRFCVPSTKTLLICSFLLFAALDFLAQSFKPSKVPHTLLSRPSALSNNTLMRAYLLMTRRSMPSGGLLSFSAQQLGDLSCFYVTALLKLAVMLSYVQLAEDAQVAIRSLAITSHRTGTVTAAEIRGFGAALHNVLRIVHSLEAAFSSLVLIWYAELMLAIVASVHMLLSFVEDSRSFWSHGAQLPRNLHLLVVYALLSHRLCSVHVESCKTAATLGPGLSARADPRRGPVCGAVKILRRCAACSEAFTLTALDTFDLDDRFYVNTLKSVIMYGIILQQLTSTVG
ncbi:hypothetical protein V5799_031985 [Amblyomma americanum]|uniref:Uncharacterized protein n=1 Tax=Amblyomma americanum TaxID=6943 RepID=A0AAQ4DSG3_AMBAM